MKPFLQDIAESFYIRYGSALADVCFVLPNKRGGTFLSNYIDEAYRDDPCRPGAFVMPEITTISDFVASLSGLVPDSRIDMLFTLFGLYREMEGADSDFDRFRSWGDMALNDFNEVEMYCVDSSKLFSNLTALNEIETDYLTEGQREVVEQYFPSYAKRKRQESFWSHFNNKSSAGSKYLHLWEALGELYEKFNSALAERGLGSSGHIYRLALEEIEKRGEDALPYRQVVFVGFNALTTVEYRIFKAVGRIKVMFDGKLQSLGDYYWDADGEILQGDNSAAHFIMRDRRNFHSKIKLTASSGGSGLPSATNIVACPGNTSQAKVVSGILREIKEADPSAARRAGGTLVAMADEGLFFPMLYSLPSELEEVNITMGYPLKLTATFSWMKLLRTLQAHGRMEDGEMKFMREDMLPFLSHPLSRAAMGSRFCQAMATALRRSRMFMTGEGEIREIIRGDGADGKPLKRYMRDSTREALDLVLTPFSGFGSAEALCRHLLALLDVVSGALSAGGADVDSLTLKKDLEIDNLHTYADAVRRFSDAAGFHGVEMNHNTAFALINHLLASEKISLQGEPLSGVQIMGMLETRSLDFDNVIITSLNERIFPRRLRNRSFIPSSLRQEFGMATTRFQESIFAYYFFRLISRARKVWLLYDTSSTGVRSGDPSRYIYQLRYLYSDKANITESVKRVKVSTVAVKELKGEKTPGVREELALYLNPESGRELSASAMKMYLNCPLKFYFRYLRHMKVKEEETEAMSPALIGTVYHDTLHKLYCSIPRGDGENALVTRDIIEGWLAPGDDGLTPAGRILKDNILSQYIKIADFDGDLQGFAKLYFDPIYIYIRDTLKADLLNVPFEFVEGEVKRHVRFPLGDGRKVNMVYVVDREDKVKGRTRLIDYKTGTDAVEFKDMNDVFNDKHAVFQLMLYASMRDILKENPEGVRICVAKPAQLPRLDWSYDVTHAGKVVESHLDYKDEFEERVRKELNLLFDDETPFTQREKASPNDHVCKYCEYAALCRKK